MPLIQNGRYAYFWKIGIKTRSGADFSTPGATQFDMHEVDLATGETQDVKEFSIKMSDRDGWMPVAIGFANRHARKEFPFADAGVPRNEFLQLLKTEVIMVKEVRFRHGVAATRVSLRNYKSIDNVLYTLFEGAFDNKLHFATSVNTEDLLRLQDRAITNKHQVRALERLAKDVGVLYLTEDSKGNGYYQLVELQRDGAGTATACPKVTSITVSPTRLEAFKRRVLSSNYKYLYDDLRGQFFMRKTTPIYEGAIVISDLIMNKIIFMEVVDGENCRLRVTHMKNHGLSYQKISCQQLASHPQYATFREECLTLSSLLASNLFQLDSKLLQQVIVSRTTKNMFRCEDTIYHLQDDDRLVALEDASMKVKSLSLMNSDYIADSGLRQKAERLKSTKQSSLVALRGSDWQTKDRRPFLPMSSRKHHQLKFKRLMSSSGELLLARVSGDANDRSQEPKIELFPFRMIRGGDLPTDEEDDVIAKDLAWRVVNERVRFENDDSAQRPLIFCQGVKDDAKNFLRQHFWFCIYDFRAEQIVSQTHMNFPDLIVEYEIENVDVAACSEVQ